ncbi:uncharacterized protein KD926_004658 [Aspergillus affinis]|uniref:uncharacterized protein n=1 Tax=Aspergillus affinis TaxID=1070780 RepID=UPI0022FE9A2E|nr:uncharacterized protein KD926_004658 [Aspergillus affinis]KAI9035076.1 hypothetical protein KD926_004658 [Aspergillus affinis]
MEGAYLSIAAQLISPPKGYSCAYCGQFFEVTCADVQIDLKAEETVSLKTPAAIIRARVEQALQEGQAAAERADGQVLTIDPHPTAVSPWLELTRWPQYLQGQDLTAVALLGDLPDTTEPLLEQFTASVQRLMMSDSSPSAASHSRLQQLIDQAYHAIKEGRINEFDQIQINTFFRRPGIWNRPIQIHLRPATYRRYCQVWQRLVCFAHRSSRTDQPIALRHQLNTAQFAALDQMEIYGQQLVDLPSQEQDLEPSQRANEQKQAEELLIRRDLFESTLVGFLAVLGIDTKQQTFLKPYSYTSYLSGLVKMAQMLVALQAVYQAEAGRVTHPADALDEMRERFLIFGVRAPFGWITRLRAYGKKVQNSTTGMGYIYWSDDDQTLSYKELQLSMSGFWQFIAKQVQLAQIQLEGLFLLHDEEIRETIRGWNFLKDPRTRAALSTTGERWLLDRVLETSWLRDEFLELRRIGQEDHVLWRERIVTRYQQNIEKFLERLLLLVHMTGGQPDRATELLSLCHSNTKHGRHRSIFIEHGLVSTVTSYHKGYSINNTTKIIHRYLPKAVSELVVYYLWLVLPFSQALERLVRNHRQSGSPYLWPAGEGTWASERLRKVLQQEAQIYLKTKLNIMSYRHAAIAISRVHLKGSRFKRDYGTDDAPFDQQEAPGHIEARRRQYRAVSREWHKFLGFEVYLGPRKRRAEDDLEGTRPKQACITIEMDDD